MPKKKKEDLKKKAKKENKTTKTIKKKDEAILKNNLLSFKLVSSILVLLFFAFISWQLFFIKKSHFISLLPKEDTNYAIELKIDKNLSTSPLFKQWVFKSVFSEILDDLEENDQKVLLNNEYNLGIAHIDNSMVLGLSPIYIPKESVINALAKYKQKSDKLTSIVNYKIGEEDFYTSYLNNFILFSKNKSILTNLLHDGSKKENLSYQSLLNDVPERKYFTAVNLFYFKSDFILRSLLSNFELDENISFLDLLGDSFDEDKFVGQVKVKDDDISLVLQDVKAAKENYKTYSNESHYFCPDSSLLSFSGFNMSNKWKNLHRDLGLNQFSLLQTLAIRFMQDVEMKTEFDVENDLILKLNKSYCFNISKNDDSELNERKDYLLVLEQENNAGVDDFIKKLELAFIRFAPFTKPQIREYSLKDGTTAQEYIIETDKEVDRSDILYKGIRIKTTKFQEDYNHSFNFAVLKNLVLIANDTEQIKDAIDFYEEYNEKADNSKELTVVNFTNIVKNTDYFDLLNFEKTNIIQDIKEFKISSLDSGIYKIDIEI
jgi:hypothetical protein